MESVHGVDVSWLHQPNKEHHHRTHAPSSPGLSRDARPPTSSHGGLPDPAAAYSGAPAQTDNTPSTSSPPSTLPSSTGDVPRSSPNQPTAETPPTKIPPRRPTLSSRDSTENTKTAGSGRSSRRNSWMNSISSKFSSQQQGQQQPAPSPSAPQTSRPQVNGTNAGAAAQTARDQTLAQAGNQGARKEAEELRPYVPAKPKETSASFFSSLTRRLSSNSQSGSLGRIAENGGVCPRQILNVDPNRERCLVPELEQGKLRRVSFSVDVEIAGGPRYRDDDEDDTPGDKQKKKSSNKVKERAEGEALKHPEAINELKDDNEATSPPVDDNKGGADSANTTADESSAPEKAPGSPPKDSSLKREKKKRSEEERKERKEKRRKKAEESGTIPVELVRDVETSAPQSNASAASTPAPSGTSTPRPQDRPTTDPVRIYRRCCQLRESPVLKRITEQLMAPNCTLPSEPGVVTCLDLTGSRLQLADFNTLGDWLAIVPVRRLLLEDADLVDEGVRVVLAGLLAAKTPGLTRLRRGPLTKRPNSPIERSGVVEKITLKNNPKISRVGWKHIATFINMCRSVKAIDVSMIKFPSTIPPSTQNTPIRGAPTGGAPAQPVDAAELFRKALCERVGGAKLEELIMSECGLNAKQIRKIVDGSVVSGVSRLGLAGNHLDDEGFTHVLEYVRSGVCHALDLGGNDLHGKLGLLGDALTHKPDCPVWGLSLAYCNLDYESLKLLFPALAALPNFRFIDLSHNTHLFEGDAGVLHLLRRYIPKFKSLKRMHLMDVGLSAKQAIALAEILPEGPGFAHLNILQNTKLTALASATDESSQEEACALYASLMIAVRVSKSLVCIDIDVPSAENSEIVKALAKQVVAYCLRNMERLALDGATAEATDRLTKPLGGEDPRDVAIPDVLRHLVGHAGVYEHHDHDGSSPDSDYIVGGTGVVKALQAVLGEQALELRRGSYPNAGTVTPQERAEEAGRERERKGKAKEMSKSLLDSARNIRARLQPSLVKEATAGDEMAYRRLLFLDQTLQGMIQRFEDEYPETRVSMPSPKQPASLSSSVDSTNGHLDNSSSSLVARLISEASALSLDSENEDDVPRMPRMDRHNSDVNIASRAQTREEGRIHRLGQKVRRDILNAPSTSDTAMSSDASGRGGDGSSTQTAAGFHAQKRQRDLRLDDLGKMLEGFSGTQLRDIVDSEGWEGVMRKMGANLEELRQLQEQDPLGWEQFKEAQMVAKHNMGRVSSAVE